MLKASEVNRILIIGVILPVLLVFVPLAQCASLFKTSPLMNKAVLKFKLSARALPTDDMPTTDPYVILSFTEDDQKVEKKLGKTSTLLDTVHPDWTEIFEFEYDRQKRQRWHLLVYDKDASNTHDLIGFAWVTVEDYVSRKQYLQVNLNREGYLIIQKVD